MKKGFGIGFIGGILLTLIIVFIFKHTLVKWYAKRYGVQFAKAIEVGAEEFIQGVYSGFDIK